MSGEAALPVRSRAAIQREHDLAELHRSLLVAQHRAELAGEVAIAVQVRDLRRVVSQRLGQAASS